jgi:hypothetical protein
MTQHKRNQTYHRGSKLIDDEAIAAEVLATRQQLITQDDAFQAALHRALEAGTETDAGVRGRKAH